MMIFAITSCVQPEPLTSQDIVADLQYLQSYIFTVEAGLMIAEEDYATSRTAAYANSSRAITPSTPDPAIAPTDSPDAVYSSSSSADTVRTFPDAGGFYNDYYSVGQQAYFTMEPVTNSAVTAAHTGAGGNAAQVYKIVLKIYPRDDFNILYTEEIYYIIEAFTNYYADDGTPNRWESYKTYFVDGTAAVRDIQWVSSDDATYYDTFSVPNFKDGGTNPYAYPSGTITKTTAGTPSGTATASYSSFTVSTIDSDWQTITSYDSYTESGTDYTGVSYTQKADDGGTVSEQTVSFSKIDASSGSRVVRSELRKGDWYVGREEVLVTTNMIESITLVTSSSEVWYSQDTNKVPSSSVVLNLTETSADSGNYTGTQTNLWGSTGDVYNVSYTSDSVTGEYDIDMTWTGSASTAGNSGKIKMNSLSSVSLTLPIKSGTFEGSYSQGSFSGSYTVDSQVFDVKVDKNNIYIDDVRVDF